MPADPCSIYPNQECDSQCSTFCKRFRWDKPHKIFNGDKLMSSRECEVWAVHKKWYGRITDRIRYGHSKHVCGRLKLFAQEHSGNHTCDICGFSWPKQRTDND